MKYPNRALIATEDGSLTLRDEESGELFHNRAGAYSEALLNYIIPGEAVERLTESGKLKVLDVCFGLAYNSFVLFEELLKANAKGKVEVLAFEIDESLLSFLPEILHSGFFPQLGPYLNLAEFALKKEITVNKGKLSLSLHLALGSARRLIPETVDDFDLIFHDPFSARHAPELWTIDIFRQYYRLLEKKAGALLTYSASAAVRSGLEQAGFFLKKSPALGGKSGGTIALCPKSAFGHSATELDLSEREKIKGSSGIPYEDADFSLSSKEIMQRRQVKQKHLHDSRLEAQGSG